MLELQPNSIEGLVWNGVMTLKVVGRVQRSRSWSGFQQKTLGVDLNLVSVSISVNLCHGSVLILVSFTQPYLMSIMNTIISNKILI